MGLRFIPVYTGNSFDCIILKYYSAVYPCVYRELHYRNSADYEDSGLSLCIQGTQHLFDHLLVDYRFIPVYTGNSSLLCPSRV